MKLSQVIFLLDFLFRAVGIVWALINLLGYIWFSSTLPLALVIPPFVMFAVVLIPLKIFVSERWLLVVLATIYIASYAFGGFNFALTNDQLVTSVLPETTIIVYFFVRAIRIKINGQ